ncbi:MAG: TetR/AcrR family transcriptional regulator [Anaerolineae bacterium]
MPRPRNIDNRVETAEQIKALARQQLAERGTNGISLRGIAREMGITAPAIYNYFPRLDDLITALLVDAFSGHAEAIEKAIASHDDARTQLQAGLHAYRDWALAHPADFTLIYGNPIPSYDAPREITVPLAARPQEALMRCLIRAQEAQQLRIPARYQNVPVTIHQHISRFLYRDFPEVQAVPNHMALFYLMEVGWARAHGIVMLEIHGHLGPTLGDTDTFYQQALEAYLDEIGIS